MSFRIGVSISRSMKAAQVVVVVTEALVEAEGVTNVISLVEERNVDV